MIREEKFFRAVTKKGRFFRGSCVHLWTYDLKSAEREGYRESTSDMKFGVIVSRKVDRLATKRNLWKRRIKEIFRKNQNNIKSGYAILIQARKNEKMPSYIEIESDLIRLLTVAGVLNK